MTHLRSIRGGGDANRLEDVAAITETQVIPVSRALLDCATQGDVHSVRSFLRDLEQATAALGDLIDPHQRRAGLSSRSVGRQHDD